LIPEGRIVPQGEKSQLRIGQDVPAPILVEALQQSGQALWKGDVG